MKGIKLKNTIRFVVAVFVLASSASIAKAQEVAVKTNLLYDATTTPNLGVEVGVGKKNTLQLFYGLNPWKFNSESHGQRFAKHWLLMPEYRWWTCTKFNGHFIGAHLMGGEFNAANVNLVVPGFFFSGENLQKDVKDHRFEAIYAGAGVTYGYQWIVSRHWNFEAEIGAGYMHAWYKKFDCDECGRKLGNGGTNYIGLTKIGLSVLYIF